MKDKRSSDTYHREAAEKAARLYVREKESNPGREEWHLAKREAISQITHALRESRNLSDVECALRSSGRHMRVFRNLMAPPLSQDQFKLMCPGWPKQSEKSGVALKQHQAAEAAEAVYQFVDRALCSWLGKGGSPSRSQVKELITSVAPILAMQDFATIRRNSLAAKQEQELIGVLEKLGWSKLPSKLVDERADLPARHFMHKTRFATATSPQEVDVACGLGRTFVLAVECKVTNDRTNSVKRVNDVLKKASAWKDHWGNFVSTAALLQGVIAPSDVERLINNGVEVFWSHDLKSFEDWIRERSG